MTSVARAVPEGLKSRPSSLRKDVLLQESAACTLTSPIQPPTRQLPGNSLIETNRRRSRRGSPTAAGDPVARRASATGGRSA